jgi:hypothetical protein
MNRFRRSVYRRLLALVLLVGMGTWLSAPFAAAHPQAAAAQMARAIAGGSLEGAIAEALAIASKHERPSEVFGAALQAALETHPEGKALAEFLAEHESPELVLDLLIGQLLRSQGAHHPLMLVAALTQSVPSATGGSAALLHPAQVNCGSATVAADQPDDASAPVISIRDIFAAQPLGP